MDDNFILAAYSEYLKDAPEWPKIRNETRQVTRLTKEGPEDVTLFIRECFRLAYTKNKEFGYYDFYLRNTISPSLKKIRIFGKILSLDDRTNAIDLKVYDGTGVIKVHYNINKSEDDAAAPLGLGHINKEDDFDVDAIARGSATMRDKSNRKKVNEDPSREVLKVKGFMTAIGFVTFTFTKKRTESDEQNLWKCNMMPPILFAAYEVKSLTEQEYVDSCTALAELFKKRYTRD